MLIGPALHVAGGPGLARGVPRRRLPADVRLDRGPAAGPGDRRESGGATRYLTLGPFPFQPSELAKLAFLLWGADLLARKDKLRQLNDWRHLLIPLLPGAGILAMLVMLGDDLGTTFLLLVIFLTLLWVIGTPAQLYAGILGMIGLVLLILIVVAGYRFQRLNMFFHPTANPLGPDMQPIQGK